MMVKNQAIRNLPSLATVAVSESDNFKLQLISKPETQVSARLIDFSDLIHRTTLGKTKLYEFINAGELRPIKLGRKTVFCEQEVNAWIEKQIANRGVA